MKFKNTDSWKAAMKRTCKEKNMNVQDVQQRYILEEFSAKISHSQYRDSFIIRTKQKKIYSIL